jgi:NADH-quinone oxidoreductase subunit A
MEQEKLATDAYLHMMVYLFVVLGFIGVTLGINALLGPRPKSTPVKLEPFECGVTPVDERNVKRIYIKYYAFAIFFVLFDIDIVFLFVWALSSGDQGFGGPAMGLFAFFMVCFLAGFVYVWKEGMLEWKA